MEVLVLKDLAFICCGVAHSVTERLLERRIGSAIGLRLLKSA